MRLSLMRTKNEFLRKWISLSACLRLRPISDSDDTFPTPKCVAVMHIEWRMIQNDKIQVDFVNLQLKNYR